MSNNEEALFFLRAINFKRICCPWAGLGLWINCRVLFLPTGEEREHHRTQVRKGLSLEDVVRCS